MSGSPGAVSKESSGGGWESRDEDPELGLAPGGSARGTASLWPLGLGPTLQGSALARWGWTEPSVSGRCGLHPHTELIWEPGNDHTESCHVTRQYKSQAQKRLNTDLLQTHTQMGGRLCRLAPAVLRWNSGSDLLLPHLQRENRAGAAQQQAEGARETPGRCHEPQDQCPPAIPRGLCATVTAGGEGRDATLKIKSGKKTADRSTRLSKFPTSLRSDATAHLVTPGDPQRKGTRRLRCTRGLGPWEGLRKVQDELSDD